MVCRTHSYADGGKIVKDHYAEVPRGSSSPNSPGVSGAIKDAVGAVAKAVAPKSITQRRARLDKQIEDAGG